jgi:hypothetical protein
MKLFHLYRSEDVSGVSGTGPVVEGVEFTNGWCALRWMSNKSTICFYQSIADVQAIHSHGGRTELIVHDFEAAKSDPSMHNPAGFESFLQVFEDISGIMSLAQESTSPEEIHEAIEQAKSRLDELERALANHRPGSTSAA